MPPRCRSGRTETGPRACQRPLGPFDCPSRRTGENATWPTTSPFCVATSDNVRAPESRRAAMISASFPPACGAFAKASVVMSAMAAASSGRSSLICIAEIPVKTVHENRGGPAPCGPPVVCHADGKAGQRVFTISLMLPSPSRVGVGRNLPACRAIRKRKGRSLAAPPFHPRVLQDTRETV